MDKSSKFRIFLILLCFCTLNFFVYRYFSGGRLVPQFDKNILESLRLPWVSSTNISRALIGDLSAGGTVTMTSGNAVDAGVAPRGTGGGGVDGTVKKELTTKPPVAPPATGNVKDAAKDKDATEGKAKDATEEKAKDAATGVPASSKSLPLCPLLPPNLIGNLATYPEGPEFAEIANKNPGLGLGGLFHPAECISRHRVAIIIPYRNRESHLKVFLNNIHPFLMRQQLDYGIYVVDQALPGKFNRAMLMNIGWVEALKRHDYQCAIFHDVDLIPENDKNIYSCPDQPRHMSAAIDKFQYKLPYQRIFGGVSALRKDHLEKINGFSNQYFGWGGEDDDIASRIGSAKLQISRYPMEVARYKMIKHNREAHNADNPKRFSLLRSVKKRMSTDGLNSLKYDVKKIDEQPTHTRIEVLIDEQLMLQS